MLPMGLADQLAKEETLHSLKTEDVMLPASNINYAGTDVIRETVKSTEEVVKEMRTWLKY